jgi:hypothetical protein
MDNQNTEINPKPDHSSHIFTKFGFRLAHHRHSGRQLPVNCTSYATLFFLLAMTGCVLLFAGQAAKADQIADGAITLSGQVDGTPPTMAAALTTPAPGAKFAKSLVNIAGTCSPGLIVEAYRNGVFAGSDVCSGQGGFSFTITLVEGPNELKIRSKDGQNQYAPDSATTIIYYSAPMPASQKRAQSGSAASPSSPAGLPFLIYTEAVQRGIALSDNLGLRYEINGGNAPYAVSINWDDKSPDSLYSQKNEGNFKAEHRYERAGQYSISIKGSDEAGHEAFIQTIAVVQAVTTPASSGAVTSQNGCASDSREPRCSTSSPLVQIVEKMWPAFAAASVMTFSFWAGEKVVYIRLKHRPI